MENHSNDSAAYYKHLVLLEDSEVDLFNSVCAKISNRVDELFEKLITFMETDPIFKSHYNPDLIASLKGDNTALWNEVTHTKKDDEYIQRQRAIAGAFVQLGISCEGYLAAISFFRRNVLKALQEENLLTVEIALIFAKLTDLEIVLVTEVYRTASNQALVEQHDALKQMSTPVTQLWDGILFLPLVGFLDSRRAQDTMSAMLDMIAQTQAKVFILDISGVAVVDTAVANYLIKITKASRLMGCTCMISGISGSVAQTIVELGIHIDEVATSGNMKEALNHALGVTNAKVVYLETN